ncbi:MULTISPECIES: hypothetical protein [unclassified Pseudomonas]|uniref:hypothetical protein n=1 Tax=Pseudomonas TaxID=286 RepID=UPI0021148CA0|nr:MULTISPECIES: hypothetical protein [unclassified Pseudomonas]BDM23168.1 hypothetical protein KMS_R29250 [Pseudomonas sp. LRP2-20]
MAGGLGGGTVLDASIHPPVVHSLEFQFDGWLGDQLLESFPCFIVAEVVSIAIKEAGLSGVGFGPVGVKKSEIFDAFNPGVMLPEFVWLKVFGVAGVSDFGLAQDHRLVISEAVYKLLKRFGLENAEVRECS